MDDANGEESGERAPPDLDVDISEHADEPEPDEVHDKLYHPTNPTIDESMEEEDVPTSIQLRRSTRRNSTRRSPSGQVTGHEENM